MRASIRDCGLLAVLALSLSLPSAPARAAEEFERFFGEYVGHALVETEGETHERDLSVRIKPRKDGFSVSWTTVTYRGAVTKEKSYSIDFEPTKREHIYTSAMKTNVFGGREALDPLRGDPYVWARITGDTLTVFALLITDDGGYEMQVYDRTLTEGGMHLKFRRSRDLEPLKEITADLVRQ